MVWLWSKPVISKSHTDEILTQINEKYPNINTRKQYVSSILNICNSYNLTELYKKVHNVFNEAKYEIIPKKKTKPIEIAEEIMDIRMWNMKNLKKK